MPSKSAFFILLVFSILQNTTFAQVGQVGIDVITTALEEKQIIKADSALQSQLRSIKELGLYDSLPLYPYFIGRVAMEKGGKQNGIDAVQRLIKGFLSENLGPKLNKQIHREAAGYYEYIGELELAYQANITAFEWAEKDPESNVKEKGKIQNNLSTYSLYLGNRTQSKIHAYEALEIFNQERPIDFESLYLIYNSIGSLHWYGSRMDSSEYYYKMALENVEKLNDTPRNRHYRPALVLNNLSAVQSALGEISASILSMETTIDHLAKYIKALDDVQEIAKGKEFQYQAIDNLAGVHKGLGNYSRARDLLEYAFEQKKTNFGPESPEVFKSQIIIGQLYFALGENDLAETYLLDGLALIDKLGGDYLYWQADAYKSLALIKDNQGDLTAALHFYMLADTVYNQFLDGEFDTIYLEFLTNMALFFAETGDGEKAKSTSKKGLEYVVKNQGKNSILGFNQLLNIADIHYLLEEYTLAQSLIKEALEVMGSQYARDMSWTDSVQTELKKPRAILIQAKSTYQLASNKDLTFLLGIKEKMENAILILEKQKTVLGSEEDLSLLLSQNREIFDFSKKIDQELYELSKDEKYLNDFLGKHESSVYNKIRARLQKVDQIKFADLPPSLQEKEKSLQSKLQQSLQYDSGDIGIFLSASKDWEEYMETLKHNYPDYFNFRYGNISSSIDEIQKQIPEKTTVIRYIFIGNELSAIVMDQKYKNLVSLSYDQISDHIQSLKKNWNQQDLTAASLEELYLNLWKPLEKYISHPNVIIIPDGALFNLSFEILTPSKINSYSELSENSLLAKYYISYQYSSLLLAKSKENIKFKSNFVAFAPGFFDQMKSNYLSQVEDSLYMDKSYLSLIPQPFTLALVKKVKSLFGGKMYVEEQSTVSEFKASAGANRIIHIGTHAESNNLSPAYSRLIFSKEQSEINQAEANSLYAFDIYNIELPAKLAVLTACETGKNSLDPGEGMVSLAHAFNYAGSESLLIGLWQIDEKASSVIVEHFYQNLAAGLGKAEALQKAKLHYLSLARGRELSPDFWAGLILMGDPSAITFEKSSNWWTYLGILLGMILVVSGWRFLARPKKIEIKS